MCELLGRGDGPAVGDGLDLAVHLAHAGLARARDRLIRADDDPPNSCGVVQRLQRDDHLDRGAVGVGDDPFVACDLVGVDLGDDEGYVGVHPPGARVIDDDGARLGRDRAPLLGDRGRRARKDDVDSLERLRRDGLDGVRRAAEDDRFAGAARRSQEFDRGDRKLTLFQQAEHYAAHGPAGPKTARFFTA